MSIFANMENKIQEMNNKLINSSYSRDKYKSQSMPGSAERSISDQLGASDKFRYVSEGFNAYFIKKTYINLLHNIPSLIVKFL